MPAPAGANSESETSVSAAPELLKRPSRKQKEFSNVSGKLSPKSVEENDRTTSKIVQRPVSTDQRSGWDPDEFAQQQIVGLVQKVFYPGWPRPSRQVVFCSVDDFSDAPEVCARVSFVMAQRLPGTVCAIEAGTKDSVLDRLACTQEVGIGSPTTNAVSKVRENLWLLSSRQFCDPNQTSPASLRTRLSDLRRQFDYGIIHCPPVTTCSQTALIGQLADGVILVLDEQRTRRAAAREAQAILHSLNARLLGVVLKNRRFPIPEYIYRRL